MSGKQSRLESAAETARMSPSDWLVLTKPLQGLSDDDILLFMAVADLILVTTTMELCCLVSLAEIWATTAGSSLVSARLVAALREKINIAEHRFLCDKDAIDLRQTQLDRQPAFQPCVVASYFPREIAARKGWVTGDPS